MQVSYWVRVAPSPSLNLLWPLDINFRVMLIDALKTIVNKP